MPEDVLTYLRPSIYGWSIGFLLACGIAFFFSSIIVGVILLAFSLMGFWLAIFKFDELRGILLAAGIGR